MTLLTEFLSVKSWRIKKEETSQDIGFTRNNQWFRYRAAGIIIKDDAVLMVGNIIIILLVVLSRILL